MIHSPEPAHPTFISEWPGSGRVKLVLREKRFLQLASIGVSLVVLPFILASALSTLRGLVPGLPGSLGDGVLDVGCVTLPVGLMVTLVALVSLQRLRRTTGSRRCTALYLRPKDDDASRKRLENALYNLVGSRIRLLQLADQESTVTSQAGIVVRLVVSALGMTFLLLTLELYGLIPKRTDVVDTALVMITGAIVELGYRKFKRISRAKGPAGTCEELEAEVQRARSWIEKGNTSRKSVITFAPSVAIWTDVIRQLVPLADVILLDVSRPGVGLAWELSYCLSTIPNRLLVLGREADIRAWLRDSPPEAQHIACMKELLSGRQILVYDRAPKDFPQALLAALLEISEGGGDLPDASRGSGAECRRRPGAHG